MILPQFGKFFRVLHGILSSLLTAWKVIIFSQFLPVHLAGRLCGRGVAPAPTTCGHVVGNAYNHTYIHTYIETYCSLVSSNNIESNKVTHCKLWFLCAQLRTNFYPLYLAITVKAFTGKDFNSKSPVNSRNYKSHATQQAPRSKC